MVVPNDIHVVLQVIVHQVSGQGIPDALAPESLEGATRPKKPRSMSKVMSRYVSKKIKGTPMLDECDATPETKGE